MGKKCLCQTNDLPNLMSSNVVDTTSTITNFGIKKVIVHYSNEKVHCTVFLETEYK